MLRWPGESAVRQAAENIDFPAALIRSCPPSYAPARVIGRVSLKREGDQAYGLPQRESSNRPPRVGSFNLKGIAGECPREVQMIGRTGMDRMRDSLAGVVALCLLASGFGCYKKQEALKKVWVTITPGPTPSDPPSVDINKAHISKKAEELCWKLKAGTHFEVNFRGESPFNGYHVFTDAKFCSGAATVAPDPYKEYKYEVTVDGSKPLDPGLIVDP